MSDESRSSSPRSSFLSGSSDTRGFFPTGALDPLPRVDEFCAGWFGGILQCMDERPFFPIGTAQVLAFRFLSLPSLGKPAMIRVERNEGRWSLHAKCLMVLQEKVEEDKSFAASIGSFHGGSAADSNRALQSFRFGACPTKMISVVWTAVRGYSKVRMPIATISSLAGNAKIGKSDHSAAIFTGSGEVGDGNPREPLT